MKKSADLHRSERQFHPDDWVYLKLQPYIQSSVVDHSHHKLAFRFFGPYRVIGKVGTVAYRLELPPSSSVHPVFHVSQLKKAVGAHQSVTAKPPSATAIWSVPERIIQRRLLRQGTSSILQGLIKWSHLSESLATWEELEALRQQFPRALVWEHLGAQGGGSVSGDPADGMTTTKEEGEAGTAEAQEDAGRKPRSKKKNMRLFGPEWKNE
jgi:hypothetical protein